MKICEISTNRCMDKKFVHTQNSALKKGKFNNIHHMEEPWEHILDEVSWCQKKKYYTIPLHKLSTMAKFIES